MGIQYGEDDSKGTSGTPSISFVGLQWIQDSNNQVIIYRLHFFVKVGWAPNPLNKLYSYRKPSIKPAPPGGGIYFKQIWGRGAKVI